MNSFFSIIINYEIIVKSRLDEVVYHSYPAIANVELTFFFDGVWENELSIRYAKFYQQQARN